MLFSRLRNQLLILNMSVITVVMLASFAAIYMTTWKQIHLSIEGELNRSVDIRIDDHERPLPPEGLEGEALPPSRIPLDGEFEERGISFTLLVDASGTIESVRSFYQEEASFYEEAFNAAISNGETSGTVDFADSRWAYLISERSDLKIIGFTDIDERLSILNQLLITFLAVTGGTLLLIFAVSSYLTKRALRPAEEAFAKQKEFISHASHELKTPLAVIGANTELLLEGEEGTRVTPAQARMLGFMKTEVQRMGTLLKNLLFLAGFDEGRNSDDGVFSQMNLSEAVESHLLGMEGFIYEKGFSLAYTVEENLYIDGSREQLLQVLSSLIDNAVKYGDAGSCISVTLRGQGGKVLLEVTNTGEGISPQEREKVFDRFYRGDQARDRSQSSYGLGLSIVKAIAEHHNGTISVSSEHRSSGTTTFTLRLPLSRVK